MTPQQVADHFAVAPIDQRPARIVIKALAFALLTADHAVGFLGGSVTVRKQGAWGLWWLVVVTFGVYYYVWYQRINDELTAITGQPKDATCEWWSQLIPFYNLYALAKTASRVNAAHIAVGSTTRVSSFVTWFWAPAWFASQTRYLQRRINVLADVQSSRAAAQPGQYAPPPTQTA